MKLISFAVTMFETAICAGRAGRDAELGVDFKAAREGFGRFCGRFARSQAGAVTVDWIGLMVLALGVSVAATAMVARGIEAGSSSASTGISGLAVAALSEGFGASSQGAGAGPGGPGNPGNHRANGAAGENPNGGSGWGSGAGGMSQ